MKVKEEKRETSTPSAHTSTPTPTTPSKISTSPVINHSITSLPLKHLNLLVPTRAKPVTCRAHPGPEAGGNIPPQPSPPLPIQVKTSTRLVNLPSRWWRNGSVRSTCFFGLAVLSLVSSACSLLTSRHCYIQIGTASCPSCSVVLSPAMMVSPSFWDAWDRVGAFAGRSVFCCIFFWSLSWSRGQVCTGRFHAQQQH